MIIFPAMDLLNGNVVKLEAAHHKREEKVYGTPALVTDRWLSAGAYYLHRQDSSNDDFFSFYDNQVGVRATVRF